MSEVEKLQRLLEQERSYNQALVSRLTLIREFVFTKEFHQCVFPDRHLDIATIAPSYSSVSGQLLQAEAEVKRLRKLKAAVIKMRIPAPPPDVAHYNTSNTVPLPSVSRHSLDQALFELPSRPAVRPPSSQTPMRAATHHARHSPQSPQQAPGQQHTTAAAALAMKPRSPLAAVALAAAAVPRSASPDINIDDWDWGPRPIEEMPAVASRDAYVCEEDSPENIMTTEDDGTVVPMVKAGTLDKLIERITFSRYADVDMTSAFLATYSAFVTSHILLTKLMGRFAWRCGADTQTVQLRVCNVLKRWVTEHWEDFEVDKSLLDRLLQFAHTVIAGAGLNKFAAQLVQLVTKKMNPVSKGPPVIEGKMPKPLIPRALVAGAINLLDLHPQELARQLCILEFDLFSMIPHDELMCQRWTKPGSQFRAQHVHQAITHFNVVSRWVSDSVLSDSTPKGRANVIQHFVTVAEHCRKLNNFNGLLEIVTGLNTAAVKRLKLSWAQLSSRTAESFDELAMCVSDASDFQGLRAVMHSETKPCLPYLGLYLTDLTFADSVQARIGSMINFAKHRRTAAILAELETFKAVPYVLQPVPIIQYYLKQLSPRDGDELWRVSLEREARIGRVDSMSPIMY
eukprot:TRINITY_DN8408_c0_g1_i1.p1 TRINITY_DN8408_c0_g1~~TRINITY_DN8408_c0_g1_i1.p1  ORF type:complete len:626 (+),score=142.47 TRINITY_DN8408_c0_g1_i1:55-1932(+)